MLIRSKQPQDVISYQKPSLEKCLKNEKETPRKVDILFSAMASKITMPCVCFCRFFQWKIVFKHYNSISWCMVRSCKHLYSFKIQYQKYLAKKLIRIVSKSFLILHLLVYLTNFSKEGRKSSLYQYGIDQVLKQINKTGITGALVR